MQIMKNLSTSFNNMDDIQGVTLKERAKLVLITLGRTPDEIKVAYRKLAHKHHPDTSTGNTITFQVINEAYGLLTGEPMPKRPLLADDALIQKVAGRHVQPLIDKQKKWEEYEKWRRDRFYGVGVI